MISFIVYLIICAIVFYCFGLRFANPASPFIMLFTVIFWAVILF